MNISNEIYVRLINHLTQDETDEERVTIEAMLAQDEELQKEFEQLQLLQTALQRNKILEKINEAHAEIQQEAKVIQLRRTRYTWLAAASVALIVGIWGIGIYQQNSAMDGLYQTYSTSANVVTNTMTDSLCQKGLDYLQQNQTEKAIETLSKSQSQEAQWYLALAYLKNHDNQNAKITLQAITKTPQHLFKYKAGQLLQDLEK